MKSWCWVLAGLLFAMSASISIVMAGGPAFQQTSSVLDGSGGRSTGGSFTHLSAAGQPGGISESFNGGIVNQAGFLQTFFMQRNKDTDGDGIPDEADLDNDGDGLRDTVEIAGSGFNPTTPTDPNARDSDGDGIPDDQESVAGTDPTDNTAFLALITITNAAGSRNLSWLARGNNEKVYKVHAVSGSYGGSFNQIIFSNTVAGGAAPWFAVTNTIADSSPDNQRTFAVEVLP